MRTTAINDFFFLKWSLFEAAIICGFSFHQTREERLTDLPMFLLEDTQTQGSSELTRSFVYEGD